MVELVVAGVAAAVVEEFDAVTSRSLLQTTSTVMFPDNAPRSVETVLDDDLVRNGKKGTLQAAGLLTDGHARLRRSLTRRWTTTGEPPTQELVQPIKRQYLKRRLKSPLPLQPLLVMTILI